MLSYEIGRVDPQFDSHYIRDVNIAAVACLRKRLFGEDGKDPYFLLTTSPFAVAYNGELSYRLITRLEEDLSDD